MNPLPAGEPAEHELAEYRSLSPHAVLGVVLGLLSIAALVDPMLWVLPVLGVAVSAVALWRIARDPQALAGRKLAWIGLGLSLVFAAAAPTDWFLYRELVRREAVAFARPWFQLFRQGQTYKAFLLTVEPQSRLPLDVSLPELCRRASYLCAELDTYRKDPVVKALEALGGATRVQLLRIDAQGAGSDRDFVRPVFQVTAGDGGRTLHIMLSMERLRLRGGEGLRLGHAEWRILRAEIVPS
jgi:hypothetical protein